MNIDAVSSISCFRLLLGVCFKRYRCLLCLCRELALLHLRVVINVRFLSGSRLSCKVIISIIMFLNYNNQITNSLY